MAKWLKVCCIGLKYARFSNMVTFYCFYYQHGGNLPHWDTSVILSNVHSVRISENKLESKDLQECNLWKLLAILECYHLGPIKTTFKTLDHEDCRFQSGRGHCDRVIGQYTWPRLLLFIQVYKWVPARWLVHPRSGHVDVVHFWILSYCLILFILLFRLMLLEVILQELVMNKGKKIKSPWRNW